jgi:hypothetical protein
LSVRLEAAVWTQKYVNSLPNSAFAFVEPDLCPRAADPSHDRSGCDKSHDLNKRHLPYRDANGNVDIPHLKNAMARVTQCHIPKADIKIAHDRLLEQYRKLGIEHQPCLVPGCKGYTPSKKGFLEDYQAFNAARRELARIRGSSQFFPILA